MLNTINETEKVSNAFVENVYISKTRCVQIKHTACSWTSPSASERSVIKWQKSILWTDSLWRRCFKTSISHSRFCIVCWSIVSFYLDRSIPKVALSWFESKFKQIDHRNDLIREQAKFTRDNWTETCIKNHRKSVTEQNISYSNNFIGCFYYYNK